MAFWFLVLYNICMPLSSQWKKVIGGTILAALLVAGAWYTTRHIFPVANAAALSEAQIKSVLSVLSAFGVDPTIVKDIESALRGQNDARMTTETAPAEETVVKLDENSTSTSTTPTSVVVSVSATPEAGYVPVGTTYVPVGSFIFDARGASEDIRFSKLSFLYTDEAKYDPYNCAIFSGSDEFMTRYTKNYFNPDWVHPTRTGDYEFALTNPFVVLKGTIRVAEIRCTINLQAVKSTGSFSWGLSEVDGRATFGGTGVTSGEAVVPVVVPNVGNTMTFNS